MAMHTPVCKLAFVLPLLSFTSITLASESKEVERIQVLESRQAYRGNVDARELPQAVSEVSADFLTTAGITDFQRAMDLVSGTARQNSFGGLWDSFAIRGFAGDENLPSAYLINGFSGGRGYAGNRDASNIERIEVLKGPGSALYGRSEPGGTVNIITKKPSFDNFGYLDLSAGSFETYRVEGDYNTVLSDQVAFRLTGAYQDAGSFRDTISSNKTVLTPSFLVQLSDATQISYELELSRQETPFDRGVIVLDEVGELPNSRFLGNPEDGPIEVDATGHQLELQHHLSGDWIISAGLGYRDSSLQGHSTDAELSSGRQLIFTDGETLTRQRRYRDYQAEDLSARVELSGSSVIGGLTHNLLFGADVYDYELHSVQERWRVGWGSGDTTYSINIHNPDYQLSAPETGPMKDNLETQQAQGVYFQDMLALSEHWKMQLGLRLDKFDQKIINNLSETTSKQSQTELSPRLGLVYEYSNELSLYTSYSEGFRPNSGADYAGNAFEPEKSKSYEAGLKWQLSDYDAQGSLALFKAEKSNVLTSDPVNSGYSAALGKAQSSGVELDMAANLSANTQLTLAYAYVDAKTSNDMVNPDWGVDIPAGSRLINIPKHSGHLTLQHFTELAGRQTQLGITSQYVGDRLGETIDPDYELPAYTLVNLFGTLAATENLDLKLTIDNLLDEAYYASSYSKMWTMPGAPRTYRVSLRYNF